jgi:phosphoglycerate kinase
MNYLSQQNPEIFNGKRIIVRVDFNVPLEHGIVSESEAFRIHAVVPTLHFLKNAGAKIILLSHIGRLGDSLAPVADYIAKELPELGLKFISEIIGEHAISAINELENGHILLLENVRKNPGEELNDPAFAKKLASYGDYFVNDAFAVSHRAHASIVGIAQLLPSFAGFLLEKEIVNLSGAFTPIGPSVLIMAGIKFETKLPLIEKLLPLYDSVILGGGLLNTYLKSFGLNVGVSVIDNAANLSSIVGSTKITIPEKIVIEREDIAQIITNSQVQENDRIVDVVIDNNIKELLHAAKTVVWNGPLGWYEKGYTQSTIDIVNNFGPQTNSIVGGGDTVTAIRIVGLENQVNFLSTGGGAMLEYLEQGTIPGITVLRSD